MAKRRNARPQNASENVSLPEPFEMPPPSPAVNPTGKFIVTFVEEAVGDARAMNAALRDQTGAKSIAAAADFSANESAMDADADAVVFANLGIAVVEADPRGQQKMAAAAANESSNVLAVEPEGMMFAIGLSKEYLRGFRDAANKLYDQCDGEAPPAVDEALAKELMETEAAAALTWGINAVRANTSRFSGQGVKVAILDTGLDLNHPDFLQRSVTHKSFIQGQTTQDQYGHGTHCTGTACGPLSPSNGTRYGIAHQALIFIGKVLSNQGSGPDTSILEGISWAVTNGCQVISMSLGSPRAPMVAYQQAGQRALNAGCLIIAAAGNESNRSQGIFNTVGCPANSGTIMAVAAVDRFLQVANFSNRSSSVAGGKVDISGPGVAVLSSTPNNPAAVPVPPDFHQIKDKYDFMNGTSMATPHVAGCAALWCQATGAKGAALYQKLVANARATSIPAIDGGTGLVQAPQ